MLIDNKFTKGEWMYCEYNSSVKEYGVYSSEGRGSDIALVRYIGNDEETLANTKIMTYAPEMLEMLKKIINNINYPNDKKYHGWLNEADRLIYKITEDGL